jgi:hypothetical protein
MGEQLPAEMSSTTRGARPLLGGRRPSSYKGGSAANSPTTIYKGGSARRPLRGSAANSPTTFYKGGSARRPLRGNSPTTARRAAPIPLLKRLARHGRLQSIVRPTARLWLAVATSLLWIAGCLPSSVDHSVPQQAVQDVGKALRSLHDVLAVQAEPPSTPGAKWLIIVTASSDAAPTLESNAQTATNTMLGSSAAAHVIVQRVKAVSQSCQGWNVGPWQVPDRTRWNLVGTGVGLLMSIAALAALVAWRHRDQRGTKVQ